MTFTRHGGSEEEAVLKRERYKIAEQLVLQAKRDQAAFIVRLVDDALAGKKSGMSFGEPFRMELTRAIGGYQALGRLAAELHSAARKRRR